MENDGWWFDLMKQKTEKEPREGREDYLEREDCK